jgi:hypothetical protein
MNQRTRAHLLLLLSVVLISLAIGALERSRKQTPREPESPSLELVSMRCERGEKYSYARGTVKNISDAPLTRISAVGRFRLADGAPLSTDRAPVNDDPLAPGQITDFAVRVENNAEIKGCTIEFQNELGKLIPLQDDARK